MNFELKSEEKEKLEQRVKELEKKLPSWGIPEVFLQREDHVLAMLNLKVRVYEQILNHNLYELLKEVTIEVQTPENPLSSLSLLNTKAASISQRLFSKEYIESTIDKKDIIYEKQLEILMAFLEKNRTIFFDNNNSGSLKGVQTQEEFQQEYDDITRIFQYNLAEMIAIAMHSGDERKIIPGPALIHPERTLKTFFDLVKEYSDIGNHEETNYLSSNPVIVASINTHDSFEDGSARKLKISGLTKSKKFLNRQENPSLEIRKDKETTEFYISKIDFTHHAILRDSLATYMIQDLYLPIVLEATKKIDAKIKSYAEKKGWEVKTSLTRDLTNTYQGVVLLLTGILGSGNSFYTLGVERPIPNILPEDKSIVDLTTMIVKILDNMDNLNDMNSLELQKKLEGCSLEESAMAVLEGMKKDVDFEVPKTDPSRRLIKRMGRYAKSINVLLKYNLLMEKYGQREDITDSERVMIGFLGFLKDRYVAQLTGSISRSINYTIVKYKGLFFQQKIGYEELNALQLKVGKADVYETQGSFDRKKDVIGIPLDAVVDSITTEIVDQVLRPSSKMLNYLSETGKRLEQVFKFSKQRVSGKGKYSKVTTNQKAYFTLLTLYGYQEFLKKQILN